MMNFQKLFTAVVLAAVLFALAGCGSSSSKTPAAASLQSITISGAATTVNVGTSMQLTATGNYAGGVTKDITSKVTWSSSSAALATVTSTGLVTGLKGGEVNISATLESASGRLPLNIVALLTSISLSANSSTVYVGSTMQYSAIGHFNDDTVAPLSGASWSSSDPSRATISSAGIVSGLLGGAVTITGSYQEFSATAPLSVVALLTRLTINPIGPGIAVGTDQQFTLQGSFNDGTSQDMVSAATWTSSSNSISTVHAGLATGVAPGAVTITGKATSADGSVVTASTALDVVNASEVPPNLSGDYAFTLTSADSRGPVYFAGSFTADGNGVITGGVEDANSAAGVEQNVEVTGTYLVYP
nr:Ig-like domain-containing protein [Terriglobales bacterium]